MLSLRGDGREGVVGVVEVEDGEGIWSLGGLGCRSESLEESDPRRRRPPPLLDEDFSVDGFSSLTFDPPNKPPNINDLLLSTFSPDTPLFAGLGLGLTGDEGLTLPSSLSNTLFSTILPFPSSPSNSTGDSTITSADTPETFLILPTPPTTPPLLEERELAIVVIVAVVGVGGNISEGALDDTVLVGERAGILSAEGDRFLLLGRVVVEWGVRVWPWRGEDEEDPDEEDVEEEEEESLSKPIEATPWLLPRTTGTPEAGVGGWTATVGTVGVRANRGERGSSLRSTALGWDARAGTLTVGEDCEEESTRGVEEEVVVVAGNEIGEGLDLRLIDGEGDEGEVKPSDASNRDTSPLSGKELSLVTVVGFW